MPDPIAGYTNAQLDDFLRHFRPTRAPGERYEYSNVAVSVLGRALARHAGMSYEALLQKRVTRPLGLISTGITEPPRWHKRLALGHGPYGVPVDTPEMMVMPASGSLRSTADNLLQYLAAYLGLISTPLDSAMRLQLATRSPVERRSALAWGAQTISGREIYSHDGGKTGFRAALAFDPSSRTGVVVLMNARTEERPMPLAMHLLTGAALPPAPVAPSPKAVLQLPKHMLDRFAGSYRTPGGSLYRVARNGHRLFVDYGRGNILEFHATGLRDFYFVAGNDELSFEADARGHVTGMRIYGDGRAAGTSELAARL
jgi:CubicO group peptidase (beta-lactamase class C family)